MRSTRRRDPDCTLAPHGPRWGWTDRRDHPPELRARPGCLTTSNHHPAQEHSSAWPSRRAEAASTTFTMPPTHSTSPVAKSGLAVVPARLRASHSKALCEEIAASDRASEPRMIT